MYGKIIGYRKRYGSNWLTSFGNFDIPWRQLTLQEYLDYNNLFATGQLNTSDIEDEIFNKIVLEDLYRDNIDILPAGVVTSIVAQTLEVSGTLLPERIQEDLNLARAQVQDFVSSAVLLICSVFPAYKPEDIFNLNWETFMKRLALAEKRLLELKVLGEPLTVYSSTEAEIELPSQRKKRELLEQQTEKLQKKLGNLNQTSHPEGIVTTSKMKDSSLSFVPDLSNDPRDQLLNQIKVEKAQEEALQGLESIYPEYFKVLKEGKKLSPELINTVKDKSIEKKPEQRTPVRAKRR